MYSSRAKTGKPDIKLSWMDGGIKPERPEELGADEPMGDWSGGIIMEGTKGKMIADCYGRNPRLLPTSKMVNLVVDQKLKRVPEGHYVQWVNACMKGYGKAEPSPFGTRTIYRIHTFGCIGHEKLLSKRK